MHQKQPQKCYYHALKARIEHELDSCSHDAYWGGHDDPDDGDDEGVVYDADGAAADDDDDDDDVDDSVCDYYHGYGDGYDALRKWITLQLLL